LTKAKVALAQVTIMRFFMSNGEAFKEKCRDFPVAKEFTSSKMLAVCIDGDNVVAACGVRSLLNVLNLYVREAYRGRGIGTQLLMITIEAAKKRKLGFIALTVSQDNFVAFRMYRRLGFKETVFLKKSRQMLMVFPLSLVSRLAYAPFSTIRFLPNSVLSYVHSWLYRKTLVP